MSFDSQFWWNWWVNAATALGTVGTVVVALVGKRFLSKVFPPRLALELRVPEGEPGRIRNLSFEQSEPRERWEDARYYHLRVSNKRRWSPAHNVQVFLVRMEEPGPDGDLQLTWIGDVPMRWRNQEYFPVTRTIGAPADCDLCGVARGRRNDAGEEVRLDLLPLIIPYSLNARRQERSLMVLSLQARSEQADTGILRVQIAWDGRWEDGAQEMQRHLVVRVLDEQEARHP